MARVLPTKGRRTVGAWCFVDLMGPVDAEQPDPMEVGPHPHIGLSTVTWLLEGEALHSDSLGTEQVIRPGQLNWMTAGHGIAHAELAARPPFRGVQMWVAQPEATRHGAVVVRAPRRPAPRRVSTTPRAGCSPARLHGAVSPARADTPLVGLDLALRRGTSVVPTSQDLRARGRSPRRRASASGPRSSRRLAGARARRHRRATSCTATATAPASLVLGGEPLGERDRDVVELRRPRQRRDHRRLARTGATAPTASRTSTPHCRGSRHHDHRGCPQAGTDATASLVRIRHVAHEVVITENAQRQRFEAHVDGDLAGILDYIPLPAKIIATHTETFAPHEGQGIGELLVKTTLERLRADGRLITPLCPCGPRTGSRRGSRHTDDDCGCRGHAGLLGDRRSSRGACPADHLCKHARLPGVGSGTVPNL